MLHLAAFERPLGRDLGRSSVEAAPKALGIERRTFFLGAAPSIVVWIPTFTLLGATSAAAAGLSSAAKSGMPPSMVMAVAKEDVFMNSRRVESVAKKAASGLFFSDSGKLFMANGERIQWFDV